MKQKSVLIGEVNVPVIDVDGEEWFPVSYLSEKVLLRKGRINFNRDFINKYTIDYGLNSGGVQEVNCISRDNLKHELKKTKIGWLSLEQRIAQNHLHQYLELELLPIDEQDTNYYDPKWLNELDDYTIDVVQEEMKNSVQWFRRCSNCNLPLPLTSRFYPVDNRAEKGYAKVCKICAGKVEYFTHHDKNKQLLRKQSLDLYQAMQDDYLPKVFEAYRKGEIKRLPDCYENKESYGEMIKILYNEKIINKNNLTQKYLQELGLKGVNKYFTIDDIYKLLYGEDFYLFPYKYPKYSFRGIKLTYNIAIQIVKNYLKENNIIITDVFTYDYERLFRTCGVSNLTNSNTLEFIVKYYNYEYAGYRFKTSSTHYYKNETNLLFDFRYFIEVDLKIHKDKIPLYLTKNVLQKYCKPLYYWIITKKNGSIFEWVDKLYPSKYEITDFEINPYRNEFDSDTEAFIHEILVEEFGSNIIYNQRNNSDTIKLKGKVPDWFLFTDEGVWVIEYFGFFDNRYTENNRILDYKAKTEDKIKKYEGIVGYNFLYLYKSDIDNHFFGLRRKLAEIKEKIGTPTV